MTKFTLRAWNIADAESLAKHANNWNIAKNMTDGFPFPYTLDAAQNFINKVNSMSPQTLFAIDINGEAVGGIGLHQQSDISRKNAELGYWLSENYWGNGIIPEAIKEIVSFGFENLDINRIFARPFGSNLASQKVLEKAGFTFESKFEKTLFKNEEFVDELFYSIRKFK